MLTAEEVKKYAHMRRLRLIDQIWKDYLQDVLLHLLYRKMPKMVFSGGTAIWKILKGDRFSEDIDAYAYPVPGDLADYLIKEFSLLGVNCTILKKKRTQNMLFIKMSLSFPSHQREIMISLEILFDKPKEVKEMTLYSPYPDVPPVEVVILSPEEMLANKVSAIYGRNKPRDVHDIYLLLKLGTVINMKLIKKKAPKFRMDAFVRKILEKKTAWKSLETLIITKLPSIEEEAEFILSCFIAIQRIE
ncbi:MAG TPA: nucleotidyl transferase AbiEii/AbiGii toxin family protein [Candidatus Aenigmarchaeota archaeon]|nr:nucleotidyl transferase AbiEii/AbiGii toxin family protein [Candidatus Aenigmarchaeota archaeon]